MGKKDFALDKEGLIRKPDTDFKDSLFVRGNPNMNPNIFLTL